MKVSFVSWFQRHCSILHILGSRIWVSLDVADRQATGITKRRPSLRSENESISNHENATKEVLRKSRVAMAVMRG